MYDTQINNQRLECTLGRQTICVSQLIDKASVYGTEGRGASRICIGYMGKQIMCQHAHCERGTELIVGRGSRAPLRTLEALGLLNTLLCNLSLICKHCDKRIDIKHS